MRSVCCAVFSCSFPRESRTPTGSCMSLQPCHAALCQIVHTFPPRPSFGSKSSLFQDGTCVSVCVFCWRCERRSRPSIIRTGVEPECCTARTRSWRDPRNVARWFSVKIFFPPFACTRTHKHTPRLVVFISEKCYFSTRTTTFTTTDEMDRDGFLPRLATIRSE